MEKIIFLKQYKQKKKLKMILFLVLISIIIASIIYTYLIENKKYLEIKIPESRNIFYNNQEPISITPTQIASDFEQNDDKPILLYLYTTWCDVCKKNFNQINEIAREFQNTDLKIIAISIDRDMDKEKLSHYFSQLGNVYFPIQFLAFKEGFLDLLSQKNINYNGVIPYTALISGEGKVIIKFSGTKKMKNLRKKIITELYQI